jgi:hypothetical protein
MKQQSYELQDADMDYYHVINLCHPNHLPDIVNQAHVFNTNSMLSYAGIPWPFQMHYISAVTSNGISVSSCNSAAYKNTINN